MCSNGVPMGAEECVDATARSGLSRQAVMHCPERLMSTTRAHNTRRRCGPRASPTTPTAIARIWSPADSVHQRGRSSPHPLCRLPGKSRTTPACPLPSSASPTSREAMTAHSAALRQRSGRTLPSRSRGSCGSYSNTAWSLLGRLIETTLRQPWETAMREYLLSRWG